MGDQFQKAVSPSELCKAAKECKRNVSHKDGVIGSYITRLTFCKNLQNDILSGSYKLRKGTVVEIYRPKRRTAIAPWFRDRVWQRSMCNNGIYRDLTRSLLPENTCCQKGKGTDVTIRIVIKRLQQLHREAPGQPVYGIHKDIRKYFPSTPHQAIKDFDRKHITDSLFLPYLDEIVDSVEDPRTAEEIEADPFGARGTGLGSQINQLHQVALLNDLDHAVKGICRDYIRYNDDFLILSHDKTIVRAANDIIDRYLAEHGFIGVNKGGIFKASNGFYFLRKRFIMTESGKIIIRLHKTAMTDERRILRAFHKGVSEGSRTMEDVQRHYQSWVSNASYAGDAPIRAMDKYYIRLFKTKPVYKLKKRYLYGRNRVKAAQTDCSGKRKPNASR